MTFIPNFDQFQPGVITGYQRQPPPCLVAFVRDELPGLLAWVRGREGVRSDREAGVEFDEGSPVG